LGEVGEESEEEEDGGGENLFERLPTELVWEVAMWLEHQGLGCLAQTCRQMADLVYDGRLWKRHFLKCWGTSNTAHQCHHSPEKPGEKEKVRSKDHGLLYTETIIPSFAASSVADVAQTAKEEAHGDINKQGSQDSKGGLDWREEYRARLECEHRGWKATNMHRLSKTVTSVDTHHNATFITSLLVTRPPQHSDPAGFTRVKASCFVLVVDRTTTSLHRKEDYLAIAPNWELDNGIVRIIEMKSYNKKKTVILHPVALTSPLLARFSSAYGSDLLAMAPQQRCGTVEIWDWPNNLLVNQIDLACKTTAMDLNHNELALGDVSGLVSIYDLRQPVQQPWILKGHSAKVTCIECHQQMIATGSGDGKVRVWDLRRSSTPLFQLEGVSISFVSSLQFDSQKLVFGAVHQSPSTSYFWQKAKCENPFRHQMLHVWNSRTFEFWNTLDFSTECTEATSPLSFDFQDNFLVVGVPRQVVMINLYNS